MERERERLPYIVNGEEKGRGDGDGEAHRGTSGTFEVEVSASTKAAPLMTPSPCRSRRQSWKKTTEAMQWRETQIFYSLERSSVRRERRRKPGKRGHDRARERRGRKERARERN